VTEKIEGAPADPPLAAWAEALADRHAWCAARGIVYVVVVAPEKSEIYPEYLPSRVRRNPPPDLITGLFRHLSGTPVRAVDVRPTLWAAKATEPEPVYFRLDTHWNPVGALLAYQDVGRAIAAALPGFAPTPVSRYHRIPLSHPSQDLVRMIGCPPERWKVPATYIHGPRRTVVRPLGEPARAALAADNLLNNDLMLESDCAGAPGPSAVVVGDSFSYDLLHPIHTDFRRVSSTMSYGFPRALIERERPAVVVQELVARTLRLPPPPDPPGVAGAARPGR